MADKKTGKKEETDGVKELKASNLDAEELQQAIEKQAQAGSQAENATEQKAASKTTQNKESGEKTAAKENKEDDDKGTPIIVRRNNSYLNRSPDSNDSEDAAKPSEDKKVIKPPSATSKVVTTPRQEQKPDIVEDTKKTSGTNDAKVADNKQNEKQTPEETEEPTPARPVADTSQPEPAKTPAPMPASDVQAPPLGTQIDKMKGGFPQTDEKQQKPTVFDTTQYHLPIKPRNTNYVNNAVAWTILVLVLATVGGYVMYRLGVLDLSRFGL